MTFTRPLNDILYEQLIRLYSSLSEIILNTFDDLIHEAQITYLLQNLCYN
jgi:hypothetical protein